MKVVRKFQRNRNRTAVTRRPPSSNACFTFSTARLMNAAARSNEVFEVRTLHKSTGGIDVRSANGVAHFFKRQFVIAKLCRIDEYLVLLGVAANNHDLGDAGYSQQSWTNDPIGKRTKFH